jgi:phosphate transport system permease protein
MTSKKNDSLLGREEGIPWVWVTGGALVTILLMIVALLGYIFAMGAVALWPRDVLLVSGARQAQSSAESSAIIGVFKRKLFERTAPAAADSSKQSQDGSGDSTEGGQQMSAADKPNNIIYQANLDFGVKEFAYVSDNELRSASRPSDIWYIERREWGPFIGYVKGASAQELLSAIEAAADRDREIARFEKARIRPLNKELERIRIEIKTIERKNTGADGTFDAELQRLTSESERIGKLYDGFASELRTMRQADSDVQVVLVSPEGREKALPVSQFIRAFQPNQLNAWSRVKLYLSRIYEFVSQNPREANTQGGVFPAIFGTVVMTLLMTLAVLPAGVMAAIYMREIARQGFLVSIVRVAVGNLAGVPSIVYGIFGLGFFCYGLGSSIDEMFFRDRLPSPTFGTGGVLWASLTLALLTLPVVIVSTEEALQAVPRSLREASYGCGATRLQTLLRVVIPRAMPGVMTGMILAMARGMGEVAPLLVTGVVKLAPQLPIDGEFPFFHFERSFMHLGFHIYDVGFQSRSAEVSRPMVFASTGLLVGLVFVLNLVAIRVRSQLRKRFEGRGAF